MEAKEFSSDRKIRYAVVGLGHVACSAILPAFKNAAQNSSLVALVSGNPAKLEELGRVYAVPYKYSYEQYDRCLRNDEIDAIYIALPNSLHREFAVRAAEAGKHVLVEKPLALTGEDCERVIGAAEFNEVKLMTAYRLHFDEANLRAIDVVHSGEIGDPRIFQATFTLPMDPTEFEAKKELGASSLFDLGIYPINAARCIFREEPLDIFSVSSAGPDDRNPNFGEITTAIMGFSRGRQAIFSCGFGAGAISFYQVVGTLGDLRVFPSFSLNCEYVHELTVEGRTRKTIYPRRDQFAPELLYFSKCILEDIEPEPSGREGLADVRVIEACRQAARLGEKMPLQHFSRRQWPTMRQEISCPLDEQELQARGDLTKYH